MDQQTTQVAITALADAQQYLFSTTAMLPRHQAQRGRNVSTAPIALTIAHDAVKDAGHYRAKPGYRLQPLASFTVLTIPLQFLAIDLDMGIQLRKLLVTLRQQPPKEIAQAVLAIFEQLR